MDRRRFSSLLLGILVGTSAACGGSPSATQIGNDAQRVYDEINAMTGQARLDALEAGAEKEGELSIYTSNTDIDLLVEGFEKLYDINVEVYRGNSESVLQRVLQEHRANYFGNDLWEDNAANLNVANTEGLLAEYDSPLRGRVREDGQQENWTANRFTVFVVGWNTDLVKDGEQPRSLEDLADPRWAGKVALELSDVDWFTTMYQYYLDKGRSEAEVEGLFRSIAANSEVVKGHTVQGELMSAGEFAIAPSIYSHTVDKAHDNGAPVAWRPTSGRPIEPVIARPNGAGLMKTARHPFAATLFMDYMLGPEGQSIISNGFRIGSVEGSADDPLAGLEVVPVAEQELVDNGKKWDEHYASVVKGASPGN